MKKIKELPTAERLHELFEYRDGKLFHKSETCGRIVKGAEAGNEGKNYRQVTADRCNYQTHRVIWKMFKGSDPVNFIDHINRDKADNRIENLRDVSHRVNSMNKNSKGVNFYTDKRKWRAKIQVFGKQYHLGYYDTEEEASEVYKSFQTAYALLG